MICVDLLLTWGNCLIIFGYIGCHLGNIGCRFRHVFFEICKQLAKHMWK